MGERQVLGCGLCRGGVKGVGLNYGWPCTGVWPHLPGGGAQVGWVCLWRGQGLMLIKGWGGAFNPIAP